MTGIFNAANITNATTLRAGLRAAVVVAFAGLLAAPPRRRSKSTAAARAAGAQERELLLCRRQDRHQSEGQPDRRSHVCRVHDPAAAAFALSDRDGARRQPDRHQFHRHPRRPRRLGAVFRTPRLRGLHRRPGRARAFGTLERVLRRGAAVAPQPGRGALRRAGALPGVAAGEAAHAMARHRQAGRRQFRSVLRRAGGLGRELRRSSRRSIRRRSSR